MKQLSNKIFIKIFLLPKSIYLVVFLFLIPFFTFSQNGTSTDEYRYLSKGYAYQHEMGLDYSKEGYQITELFKTKNQASFVGLYKKGNTSPQAILLILNEDNTIPNYICIPNEEASEAVQFLYESDRAKLSLENRKKMDQSLQAFLFSKLDQQAIKETSDIITAKKEVIEEKPNQASTESQQVIPTLELAKSTPPTTTKVLVAKGETKPKASNTRTTFINKKVDTKINNDLSDRQVIKAPNIQKKHTAKGLISVKLCIAGDGSVIFAKFTQKGSTTLNQELKNLAVETVKKYIFDKSDLDEQCGTISFHFK